ncbi:MAG TPA: hypothetical protein VJL29_04300 [Thermoguttaceae bacterium]|nr:hypothetical protein [Thermoguttaceae bacterium]
MRRILRASIPLVLLALGIASVAYGVWGHTVTVVLKPNSDQAKASEEPSDESAEEPAEESPPPPPPDPWMGGPPRDPWAAGPPRDPWATPPPDVEEPSDESDDEPADDEPARPEEKTVQDPEPVIIGNVTVGEISRSDSGQLVRIVYPAGEKPAALCPT